MLRIGPQGQYYSLRCSLISKLWRYPRCIWREVGLPMQLHGSWVSHRTLIPAFAMLMYHSAVGVGLRAAQDVGAHRESFYLPDRAFENQMWRRAFWYPVRSSDT